ncbi:MAG: RNA methyltransferase, partial [Synechococcaceae bacterium WB4_2_0811]|nr:RNA methyltransferase [Synechococcaceae bacterium WB4_2_0811]
PQVARWCRETNKPYPALNKEGEIEADIPRTLKLRC